jgi:uncharacterized protein (TIGR03435 family)
LVRVAYALELHEGIDNLVSGGPAWAKSDRFDIEAKAEQPTTREQLLLMLQGLLADRFKLRMHRDTKMVQGFALVVEKDGPKLKPATGNEEHPGTILPGPAPYSISGQSVLMSALASSLSGRGQPVTDKTGLTGRYTFTLQYLPDTLGTAPPARGRPDLPLLFQALREQLGLRLEPEKTPLNVIIIDSAEKPILD